MNNAALDDPRGTLDTLISAARDGQYMDSDKQDAITVATRQLILKSPDALTARLGLLVSGAQRNYDVQRLIGTMLGTYAKMDITAMSPAALKAGLDIALSYSEIGGYLGSEKQIITALTTQLLMKDPDSIKAVSERASTTKDIETSGFYGAMMDGVFAIDATTADTKTLTASLDVMAAGAVEPYHRFSNNEIRVTTRLAHEMMKRDATLIAPYTKHSDQETTSRKFGEALANGVDGLDVSKLDGAKLDAVIGLQQRHPNSDILHGIFLPMLATAEGRAKMNAILQKPAPVESENIGDFLSHTIRAIGLSKKSGEECHDILQTIAANEKMPYLNMHTLLQEKRMAGVKGKLLESSAQVRAAHIWRFEYDARNHDKIPDAAVRDFLHITTLGTDDNIDGALQLLIERCGKGGIGSDDKGQRLVAADILQAVIDKGKAKITRPHLVARDLAKAIRRTGSRATGRLGNQKPLKVLGAMIDTFKLHADTASWVHNRFENADNDSLTLLGAASRGFAKKFLKKRTPSPTGPQ